MYVPINFFADNPYFWDTQYKNILIFFALIKKIFLQTLVEFIFRVLGLPKHIEEKLNFHIWSIGYQIRVKRVCGVHF